MMITQIMYKLHKLILIKINRNFKVRSKRKKKNFLSKMFD